MRRTWITVIIFVLFLLEGSVLPWLLPDVWLSRVYVSPHFAFVFILYVALYVSRHLALAYGLGFGLLKDIVFFGPMIGTLSFTMGLSAYLIGLGFHRPRIRLVSALFFVSLGILLFECIQYGLYRLFNLASTSFRWAFLHEMLPDILFNLLFALIIYIPVRKLLEKVEIRQEDPED